MPTKTVAMGAVVKVVDSYGGNYSMSIPVPQPLDAVCEISQHTESGGSAEAVYRVRAVGRVLFSGTIFASGPVTQPALFGRLIVTRHP